MSPTRAPYHHGNLRTALLKEAERMVAKRGVEGLSLRELARAAGVSHSAPRRHFHNRQALIDALAVTGYQRLERQLDAAMRSRDGSFTAGLTAFAQAYVRFASRQPALLDIMFDSLHRPDANPAVRDANNRAFAAPIELIAEARTHGDIIDDDRDRVANAILVTLQGLAALVGSPMLTGEKPVPAVVADTIETLVNGLRPR